MIVKTPVDEMRIALCKFELRELEINAGRTMEQTWRNIRDWMQYPDWKVELFYKSFLQIKEL